MRQNRGSSHNQGLMDADPINTREAEISKLAESGEDVAALRQHLQEILESKPFKSSYRSGKFLQYIVEQAIAGRFDSLKERLIGVELFGRTPSYTGEDAVVRVTASEVRKRLLQFYGEHGRSSRFYLSLPLRSYIPEITQLNRTDIPSPAGTNHSASAPEPSAITLVGALHPNSSAAAKSDVDPTTGTGSSTSRVRRFLLLFAVTVVIVNLIGLALFWAQSRKTKTAELSVLPWSAFISSAHVTHLITSDPNIVIVQEITGRELSLSDYANRNYISEPNKLTPEELRLLHTILWGDDSAAAIDPTITARIAALAQANSIKIDAHAARSIQLSDLKTDDNFILLGSPRSNPWSAIFTDRLDFRFAYDKGSGQEIIQNVRPRAHELATYIPTARGWGTGRSYAIVGFLHNPDQNGHVLLLAGANGEGTEAAGKLASDLPRLSTALTRCGIQPGKLQQFELLLGLNTMVGLPSDVDILACHILPVSQNR